MHAETGEVLDQGLGVGRRVVEPGEQQVLDHHRPPQNGRGLDQHRAQLGE